MGNEDQPMTGQQKTFSDMLMAMSRDIADGKYGKDDDIDLDALAKDIHEIADEVWAG
jgi:hypothetical protein